MTGLPNGLGEAKTVLMALDVACPICGETENLSGDRGEDAVTVTCDICGQRWERPTTPICPTCAGTNLRAVPLAIVERSRGTQLSVVGIRIVHLCDRCDAERVEQWQNNRPNPLLPEELPTVDPKESEER